MDRDEVDMNSLTRRLKTVDHLNLLMPIEFFESATDGFIFVEEYCKEGSLEDNIGRNPITLDVLQGIVAGLS